MKRLLYILLLFLLAVSCQQENVENFQPSVTTNEITFTASQKTRATDTEFDTGDEIGIFIVLRPSPGQAGTLKASGNHTDNKRYRINSNGKLIPSGEADKIQFSALEAYDIYAYYPYQENVDPTLFEFIASDNQTATQFYKKCDIMTAQSIGISGSTNTVTLNFIRKFALIEIHYAKTPGETVTLVQLNSVKLSGYINLQTGVVLPSGEEKRVYMYPSGETADQYIFRAIVPAQHISNSDLIRFVFMVNGVNVYYRASSDTPLEAGKKSIFNIEPYYTIEVSSESYLTTTGAGKYKKGDIVTLATTSSNPTFGCGGYTDEGGVYVSSSPVYRFVVTGNRKLLAKRKDLTYFHRYSRAFSWRHTSAAGGNNFKDEWIYPVPAFSMKAGEKGRLETFFEIQEKPENGDLHSIPTQITKKGLKITCNGVEIAHITEPDGYIFTAPYAGTYNFEFYMTVENRIYPGERCDGMARVTASFWKE